MSVNMGEFEEFVSQLDGENLNIDKLDSDRDNQRLWSEMYEHSIRNFERSLEEAQALRAESIDMLKIILLLGSFYVAIFQFGSSQFDMSSESSLVFVPFVILLVSAIIFLYGYFALSSMIFGPNSEYPRRSIREEESATEYQKITTIVYFEWSDDNFDLIREGQKRFTIAVGGVFMSLGMVAGIFLYL